MKHLEISNSGSGNETRILHIDEDDELDIIYSFSTSGNNRTSSNKSTILQSSFIYINSIVGAGIIGMPYAIEQCGFFTGIIVLGIVAFLNYKSVILLIECGMKVNKLDLEELTEHYLGEKGYYLAVSSMFAFAFGGQIAYMVIIGDTIPEVMRQFFINTIYEDSLFTNRAFVTMIIAIFIMLPLCLLRELSSFSGLAVLSISSDVIIVMITLICGPMIANAEGYGYADASRLTLINSSMFAGIGAMSFAFVCQHNSFMVFKSLTTPTRRNWMKVARYSIGFAFILSLIFGLAGYLNFGVHVQGDLLNNFPSTFIPITIARLFLSFCMMLTFPLENYVAKHCLYVMYKRWRPIINTLGKQSQLGKYERTDLYDLNSLSSNSSPIPQDIDPTVMNILVSEDDSLSSKRKPNTSLDDEITISLHDISLDDDINNIEEFHTNDERQETTSHQDQQNRASFLENVLVTIVLWLSTVSIAIFAGDLSIVLALTGAVAASFLGYIIPSLIYIIAHREDFISMIYSFQQSSIHYLYSWKDRWQLIRKFLLPMFMFLFGLVALVIGVATVIINQVS